MSCSKCSTYISIEFSILNYRRKSVQLKAVNYNHSAEEIYEPIPWKSVCIISKRTSVFVMIICHYLKRASHSKYLMYRKVPDTEPKASNNNII